ncbi:conserved protein of unknown function, might belong to Serine/threonine protein kinase [Shewanella benthica]|uniref:Uncharacterized protein n=1 Tax=Shewanella benthica TaxID=43661 RepID=A0A330M3Y4_9GAMM|nr:hypothetical protein [Shewanella benthica]SQH76134.1 conserved protein of unknown function, might belong to Serine/threonine protein kinase [Shewanella benthica]
MPSFMPSLDDWQVDNSLAGRIQSWGVDGPLIIENNIPIQFADQAQSESHENQLREEFKRLQALTACSGVSIYTRAAEGDAERELYGLVASFISTLAPVSLQGDGGREGIIQALNAFDKQWFGEKTFDTGMKV